MVVEGSALGHSDLISITRYYPINGAITYKEHETLGLSVNELQDIEAGNAVRLFRRFAG